MQHHFNNLIYSLSKRVLLPEVHFFFQSLTEQKLKCGSLAINKSVKTWEGGGGLARVVKKKKLIQRKLHLWYTYSLALPFKKKIVLPEKVWNFFALSY